MQAICRQPVRILLVNEAASPKNHLVNTLGLRLIADIMKWPPDGTATREYAWLRMMASTKYDGYADFRAGSRFIENLAIWLKQFSPEDRPIAYRFVKERLVYISAAEMQRAIEAFVPETVTPHLRRLAALQVGIAPHEVWGSKVGADAFRRLLRRSLFVGQSDGSRIDILRRTNSSRLSTEQVVPMMNVGVEKWADLGKELQVDQGKDARYEHVYLLEDFTASGTTFIRKVKGMWKGKLKKFNDEILYAREKMGSSFPIADSYALHIHHYISTDRARQTLDERVEVAKVEWKEKSYGSITITESLKLPADLPLDRERDGPILDLCDRYYDHELFKRLQVHCEQAGQMNMKLGYADCALPLILEHNTPNNSIPLLWAETSGKYGHAMRPLFHRRDRHG